MNLEQEKQEQTLIKWAVILDPRNPFLAPELRKECLIGIRPDGLDCLTSHIKGKRNGCVVTNSGTLYRLAEVESDYEHAFPDAYNRLMNSLEEV